ncbi:4Fe-4S cluster-binding domain-containing protein [bacterium]|nr:4Fe-4S cluster-binding domain-containing protein [bacterium]
MSTIVFTPGCNFRCEYCHNSEFVLPEKLKNVLKNLIMEKAFFNFLEKRK